MKRIKNVFLVLFFLSPLLAQASNGEQIIVPLTNPEEPSVLTVKIDIGSIDLTGYKGDLVIIEIKDKYASKNKSGLKRISNSGSRVQVEESMNNINITSNSDRAIIVSVKVPYNFSINLSTEDNGNIKVSNINGEMSISNATGDVLMQNVSGSAFVSTIDGNIKAFFEKVDPDSPMKFTSVDGFIDVTLPVNTEALFKMKSDYGEVFSDFDFQIKKRKTEIEDKGKGKRKYFLEEWITGIVNNGSTEFKFQSLSGNIYIRKQ